jgi:hypothetical protein
VAGIYSTIGLVPTNSMAPSPPPDPPRADWLEYVHSEVSREGERFDLNQLQAGDVLQVFTGHTVYAFRLIAARDALLVTNRTDRPNGRVRIMGCTMGLSSTIRPDHLWCGGNLEFLHDNGHQTCTTTTICGIQLIRRSAKDDRTRAGPGEQG